MLRGGAWNNNVTNMRCTNRNTNHPTNRNVNNGFRCASDLRVARNGGFEWIRRPCREGPRPKTPGRPAG
ncbi:MAG: hypothetical protein O7C98_02930 [Planctomycetota bacterium]|nr:hypothetical protein [Planctomycetota bacterium]